MKLIGVAASLSARKLATSVPCPTKRSCPCCSHHSHLRAVPALWVMLDVLRRPCRHRQPCERTCTNVRLHRHCCHSRSRHGPAPARHARVQVLHALVDWVSGWSGSCESQGTIGSGGRHQQPISFRIGSWQFVGAACFGDRHQPEMLHHIVTSSGSEPRSK
jgi:hypothetical protein